MSSRRSEDIKSRGITLSVAAWWLLEADDGHRSSEGLRGFPSLYAWRIQAWRPAWDIGHANTFGRGFSCQWSARKTQGLVIKRIYQGFIYSWFYWVSFAWKLSFSLSQNIPLLEFPERGWIFKLSRGGWNYASSHSRSTGCDHSSPFPAPITLFAFGPPTPRLPTYPPLSIAAHR